MLKIRKINASHLEIGTTPDIENELQDAFTFKIPGYKFMPAYRNGGWSGDIKLFNKKTKQIYTGLLYSILNFARNRDYKLELNQDSFPLIDISIEEINAFLDTLGIPDIYERRDYQLDTIKSAIQTQRRTILSPTASGKSFMIYALYRFFNKKTMLIVPNTGLVHQMEDDFRAYGYTGDLHKIHYGQDKHADCNLIITTWQSMMRMPEEYFEQFEVVICDEVHGAKAKELTKIMENCVNANVRFGFTGTLDGTQTNKLIIEGLFGPVKQVVEARELMDRGVIAPLQIKSILLRYSDETRKYVSSKTKIKMPLEYAEEMTFITMCPERNNLIAKLATQVKGNTIVIFNFIEQGKLLYERIKAIVGDTRKVHLIYGKVKGEDRNEIRKQIEFEEDAIIVASYKTFSTGINIKALHNLIIASPTKAKITLLQSIGRILRKIDNKDIATLYDIGDDLSWKSRKNHTLRHFIERIKIYNTEKFNYSMKKVEFNK